MSRSHLAFQQILDAEAVSSRMREEDALCRGQPENKFMNGYAEDWGTSSQTDLSCFEIWVP